MHELDKVISTCRSMINENRRGVLVTLIRTQGSTYRRAGARVVIAESGEATGAVSGGCLERDLAERIRPWLADMQPRVITYDSSRSDDVVFGLGLGCRGVLELFVEPFDVSHVPPLVTDFHWNGREPIEWTMQLPNGETLVESIRPQRAIAIFGSGADVEPVASLARTIGWRTDVITTRDPIDVSDYDAAIVMTHNFQRDADALAMLLQSQIAYIGLLGPKSRGDELLGDKLLSTERDPRIHNPIGLDLGSETPEEIALSIIAEIQAVLNRRTARALRELDTPIHHAANTKACA
jgi:xanthine/CO dehydrogenase XdhC/CoxF family maturation factor